MGDRIRGTLGDIDPLNKVPVEESQKRVQKGSLLRVPLLLPRSISGNYTAYVGIS